MPYIVEGERPRLDALLVDLAAYLAEDGSVGEFNYALTRIITARWLQDPRYSTIAMLTGILENVKQEFYRRVAGPYEDSKKDANGDVYGSV